MLPWGFTQKNYIGLYIHFDVPVPEYTMNLQGNYRKVVSKSYTHKFLEVILNIYSYLSTKLIIYKKKTFEFIGSHCVCVPSANESSAVSYTIWQLVQTLSKNLEPAMNRTALILASLLRESMKISTHSVSRLPL